MYVFEIIQYQFTSVLKKSKNQIPCFPCAVATLQRPHCRQTNTCVNITFLCGR